MPGSLSLRSQLPAVGWSCACRVAVQPTADFFPEEKEVFGRGWFAECDGISGVMTAVSTATCRCESASPCCGGREHTELPVPSFAAGTAHENTMLGQGRGVCMRSELRWGQERRQREDRISFSGS